MRDPALVEPEYNLTPLVICPQRGLFEQLSSLWAGTGDSQPLECHPYMPPEQAVDLISQSTANVCFLDVGTDRQEALGLLKVLRSAAIPVVALHGSNDPDLILICLREGAGEFLSLPCGLDQFGSAMLRVSRNSKSAGGRFGGEVFCFMPGKGACGSTTVACNFAFQLQNLTGEKVLLADLDPLTGTIAFLLKVTSEYSFVHALANCNRMDEDLWSGLVTHCRGVDVLLSPDNPVDIVQDPHDLATLVGYWRRLYPYVVVDIAGPYNKWGLELSQLCDSLMVVSTNDLPAIHATQNALAYLERNGVSRAKVKPIVNCYNSDMGLDQAAIEAALDLPVLHLLPSDTESIQKALLEGRAVAAGTKVGKSVTQLVQRLTGRKPVASRKTSLLGGLFSIFETS